MRRDRVLIMVSSPDEMTIGVAEAERIHVPLCFRANGIWEMLTSSCFADRMASMNITDCLIQTICGLSIRQGEVFNFPDPPTGDGNQIIGYNTDQS